MKHLKTFYTSDRQEQRMWLAENFETESEIWFVFLNKRIRIAYIDAARKRPDEFKKRLESFIKKTREGKIIVGYGGIDKYYK